jgi:AcrR family transcriptional regulator
MFNRSRSSAETHALQPDAPAEPAPTPEAQLGPAKSYHHGNLREALIDAALELVREKGPDAFTLREVARRAGVSHAAPYRHFSDRAALLAAAAERTYSALAGELRAAAESAPAPSGALRAAALAYVQFALNHPTGFRLLFEPEARTADLDRRSAGSDVFECLRETVELGQAAGELRSGDPAELALAALSLMHGLSCLAVGEALPAAPPTPASELAAQLFDVLSRGLLLASPA